MRSKNKLSEKVQPFRVVPAESDLLDLIPSEWRLLAKPFIPLIVKIMERAVANALAHALSMESATTLLVKVRDAAICLSVSESEVRNLVSQGELERIKRGRYVRIVRASLEAFIERHRDKRLLQ